MRPDAIFIPAGGSICDAHGNCRSTSYFDGDAFGCLGGFARVEAAAVLGRHHSEAVLVTLGKGVAPGSNCSHAEIMKKELIVFGIQASRIICEERSADSTYSELQHAVVLATEHGWRRIIIVSNEYHLPRIQAIWEKIDPNISAGFLSAEEVIIEARPEFAKEFTQVKNSPAYKKRLESEARGLEALRSGTYRSAALGDKQERLL